VRNLLAFPVLTPCRSLALATCLLLSPTLQAEETPAPSPTPSPTPRNDGVFVPEIARAAAAEGNSAFANNDYPRARRAYKKVLDLVPDNLVALVNLGVVEFADGKTEEAEKLLRQAVQIRIETAPAWLTLGMIYMDAGKQDAAIAALTQACLYDPRNPRARNFLGVVVGRMGWIDAAQVELRKAVEIDPNYSDAHYNLAVFYLERKPPSTELARRHYYRAVELGVEPDPDIEAALKKAPETTKAKP